MNEQERLRAITEGVTAGALDTALIMLNSMCLGAVTQAKIDNHLCEEAREKTIKRIMERGDMKNVPEPTKTVHQQFDPERPLTPAEALNDGDEYAAMQFVEWMRDDAQLDDLYDLLVEHQTFRAITRLIERWSEET
jgi:hypothetical protein